VLKPR